MTPCIYVMPPCSPAQKQRLLAAADGREVVFARECTPEQREEAFRRAEFIFGQPKPEDLHRAEKLRMIQMSWAGADLYTKAPAMPEGVQVACASGAYGGVIAEYIIGGILAMYRHLPQYVRQQDRLDWKPVVPSRGIAGKTVLILGAGDIGTALARRLRPFGPAQIVGVRRTRRETPPEFDRMETLEALPELLPQADIVSCSLPDTPQTRNLLDEKALRAMKPDALLINVGRGSLLRTDVLARVLASGHLLGAVLDVCDQEPLPPEHPLWKLDNVLLTPHIAGVGFKDVPETADLLVDLCCGNLRRYLAGEPVQNLVDFQTGYRTL